MADYVRFLSEDYESYWLNADYLPVRDKQYVTFNIRITGLVATQGSLDRHATITRTDTGEVILNKDFTIWGSGGTQYLYCTPIKIKAKAGETLPIRATIGGTTVTANFTLPEGGGPSIPINVGGTWKESDAVYVNVGGTWKEADSVLINVNGTWKEAD